MPFELIAEIGTNFHPQKPLQAIREARAAGADIVKLQLFRAERLYAPGPLRERIRPWEFPLALLPSAREIAGRLWASVFDEETLAEALPHLDGVKIASGDLMHWPLLKAAAEGAIARGIPLILSVGAATQAEVETTLRRLAQLRLRPIVLHCVSAYPATWQEYRLRFLHWLLQQRLVGGVGLSDHTRDERAAEIAIAMGARWIERHFKPSLLPDPRPPDDGPWSFSEAEFSAYRARLVALDQALGDGRKVVSPSEASERLWARRGSDGLRPVDTARKEWGH